MDKQKANKVIQTVMMFAEAGRLCAADGIRTHLAIYMDLKEGRIEIALGDLSDAPAMRNSLLQQMMARGYDTEMTNERYVQAADQLEEPIGMLRMMSETLTVHEMKNALIKSSASEEWQYIEIGF